LDWIGWLEWLTRSGLFLDVKVSTDLENVLDAKAPSIQRWIDWSNKVRGSHGSCLVLGFWLREQEGQLFGFSLCL